MKKQLYCDVDSTINNHWVRIQKWSLPRFPGNSIHPNAFTRDEIMKDSALPDALESIKTLSKIYDIHFLTARNFSNAYEVTKEWLDLHKFPYKSINVVKKSKDKPAFLNQRRCDLFIDDLSAGQEYGPSYVNLYHETISMLNNLGIKYEIFKNNWKEIVRKYNEQ